MSTLSETFKNVFIPDFRQKGERYFRQGLVEISETEKKRAAAFVSSGKDDYYVEVKVKNDSLQLSCECNESLDYGTCPHIWATLLAIDAEGLFAGIDEKRLTIENEFPDNEEDGTAQSGGALARVTGPGNPLSFSRHESSRSDASPWSALLASMARIQAEEAGGGGRLSGGEILYTLSFNSRGYEDDSIALEISLSAKDANGIWKRPKALALKSEEFNALGDPIDRKIMLVLFGAPAFNGYTYNSYGPRATSWTTLTVSNLKDLVPLMLESGRLFFRTVENEWLGPLKADQGGAWELRLTLLSSSAKKYTLEAALWRGGERRELDSAVFLSSGGFIFWKDLIVSPLDDRGCFGLIGYLRKNKIMPIPQKDLARFLEAFYNLSDTPPLDLPDDLRPTESRVVPRPLVRISTPRTVYYQNKLSCIPYFIYDTLQVLAFPRTKMIYNSKSNSIIFRDKERENDALRHLWAAGINPASIRDFYDDGSPPFFALTKSKLPSAVRMLLAAGWEVEAEGKLYRKNGTFSFSVDSSGVDWFDLRASCDFDGAKAELPELLAALEKGERFVRLDDGSIGMLPEEWLKKYAPFARMGEGAGEVLRFRRSQALIVDMLLAEQPEAGCDEVFRRLRDDLRGFSGIEMADAPGTFSGTLRPYQREGLGWMYFLRRFGFGGCLADDMGLGKTVQVLAMLAERYDSGFVASSVLRSSRKSAQKRKPSLLVAPRSLVFNWMREAARFAPALRFLDYSHPFREKDDTLFDGYDVVLITYGTLRRDIENLMRIEFDYVILDEAQAIKNASTVTAKTVRLLKASHRLALSGTPVENHLGELWSIFEFLNPGMLGGASVFRETQDAITSRDSGAVGILRRALRPFILRRTKTQVAADLPPKQEKTLVCEMEPEQRKLYTQLRDHYRVSLLGRIEEVGINNAKILILEALLRLRQAACHPGLIDPKRVREKSAKLEALLAQLDEVIEEGHKALVFSQFTSLLAIVRRHLDAKGIVHEYLDGQTKDRQEKVERFQDDQRCPVFLISLKAGGLGLNLTAAEYVFLLDPWWNPAVEAQAIDRTHRIGQTRPVFAYRLICKDTVEEKILELQKSKRELADSIITADNSVIRSLKPEDLRLLLS